MLTVHKYKIHAELGDCVRVQMPEACEPLYIGIQGQELFLWAYVNTELPLVPHTFYIRGTGQDCIEIARREARYVGTVQINITSQLVGGTTTQVVVHVFYAGRSEVFATGPIEGAAH